METGNITLYHGNGKGKSSAALGLGLMAAARGKSVIFISFMKGKDRVRTELFSKLEPDFRLFYFSKSDKPYRELNDSEKQEERATIQNGINFAKKVLQTGECDFLIIDEILGLIDEKLCTVDDLKSIFSARLDEDVEIVVTGNQANEEVRRLVNNSYIIEND